MKLEIIKEEIHLLPEKAFFWPKEEMIGLSDVHLGKAESLQDYGIPVPSGSHLEDLTTIGKLIERTKANKVFILGDLIHQKNSWTTNIVSDLTSFFKNYKKINWTLLIGNHEKGSIEYLKQFPIQLIENDFEYFPFLLTHGHNNSEKKKHLFRIQGHVHPVIQIRDGSTKLRLPCFVLEKNSLTLPSFGTLTGGFEVAKTKGRRMFATTNESVLEIP